MVGACLAAVMSVNFLDLLQLNRCLLSIGKFLQLRFGPTDLLVVVPWCHFSETIVHTNHTSCYKKSQTHVETDI
jgi:hypothetical protein